MNEQAKRGHILHGGIRFLNSASDMTHGKRTDGLNRSSWLAAGLALGIVLAGGIGYRVAASRMGRMLTSAPMPRGTLAALPMDLDGWSGQEFVLDEKLIRATDTDDHVCRQLTSRQGLPAVMLFVGYGINLRDLTPHRPEVCYIGQGWTQIGADTIALPLPDGGKLPCRLFRFRKGDLSPRVTVVLHYYIADGKRGADVDWLLDAALRGSSRAHYAARVQIECQAPDTSDGVERAMQSVQRVALASADPILGLMPRIESGDSSASSTAGGGSP